MNGVSRHTEWLSLVEWSGPFLAVPVLDAVFPQGIEAVETRDRRRLRSAHEEWREAVDEADPQLEALHREWVRLVLEELLEYDPKVLKPRGEFDGSFSYTSPEHGITIAPDWAVLADGEARLLVAVHPPGTGLESPLVGDGWPASAIERMTLLCRATGVRLGLVTDGERWTLVNAPVGATSGHASWYARLWFQEPVTLQAFSSLLGVRRCFGPADETLVALLEKSLEYQEEVTDTLGQQVRRAVEVLIQALDRADVDRNRELLRDVRPAELYEAGLTVMMRLVFVLCAEERGLLLLGDPVYDRCYAVSPLRAQLADEAGRHGPEVLERRHDAWSRLLAVFRAVYGGMEHESLRLPALGGSLFDPNRFPFLEGRAKGTNWRDTPASPLPIDNRTVLMLLEALQILEQRGGALLLSYKALDVEQIGHVYEGLLEYTVGRVPRITLGLVGSQKATNPNVALAELESARLDGEAALIALLLETTGRSEAALRNALSLEPDDALFGKLLQACGGESELAGRVRPFANLLRTDNWGEPLVYREGAFAVTLGADRRETGTHYTPKSLTETIVETTLEPVAYVGPAEGFPREEWRLKSDNELLELKLCDPAMGSGAFLVQACRWLAERLVEAWGEAEAAGRRITVNGETVDDLGGLDPMPTSLDDRLTIARRLVAERCLYGVDMNPLAVELAKLSLWLTTLAKGRPFGFLDHNLRCGDSLLGIHRLDQLTELTMMPSGREGQMRLFGRNVERAVRDAIEIRRRLRETPIRDIRDVEAMARLDAEARRVLEAPERVADALVGEALRTGGGAALEAALQALAIEAQGYLDGDEDAEDAVVRRARDALTVDLPQGKPPRRPCHWPLEFPEVFARENGGFDAFVGNPPFLGNRLWKGAHGEALQRMVQMVLGTAPGKIDLCVAFHRRVVDLLRSEGGYGLLATSNIAEGSAITVGLGEIVKRGDIHFSRKGLPWPGKAAVVVAIVCFHKGTWRGRRDADGQDCERVGPRLECESGETWEPKALKNAIFSFEGVNNSKGLAFVVTPDDPWFEPLKSEPDSLLRPYVTGDDITSHALNRIERWALDIADRGLDEIERRWPVAYRFLTEVVQPTRTPDALKSYKGLYDRWWQFWNHRADLMRRLRQRERFIAYSKVTKHPICMLAPTGWIYTNQVVLIGIDRDDLLAVCLSTPFRSWLEAYSGGGLGVTLRLSISESVAKFPLPLASVSQAGIDAAARFNDISVVWSADRGCGLTEVMNAIHSPDTNDERIVELRSLLETIDAEIAAAYGWHGLDLEHGFRQIQGATNNDRWRHAVSEATRAEILNRLSELNRERYEEEVARGLSENATRPSSARAPRTRRGAEESTQATLDLGMPSAATASAGDSVVYAASANESDYLEAAESRARYTAVSAAAILDFLRSARGWHAKSDIVAATGLSDGQWNTLIADLVARGLVERQGERRGARYRLVE